MKSTPKWLLIPPAVAILLVLGPLAMGGSGTTAGAADGATPGATPAASTRGERTSPALPKTPDLWQMGSTLVGVLLLGVGGLFALKRLRNGPGPTGTTTIATLRQSVRLSQRQALHAVEFEDRILLIGESERGLTLLDHCRLPNAEADEREVLARHADVLVGDDDDGAVPKDLVIPRPPAKPTAKPPAKPATTATPAAARAAGAGTARLNDFRSLLQKAGR